MPNPNTLSAPSITLGQTLTITLQPQDSETPPEPGSLQPGNVPTWANQNPSIVTVTPASDGLSAVVTPVAPGSYVVTSQADSNFNGGTQLNLIVDGTVQENPATQLSATFQVNSAGGKVNPHGFPAHTAWKKRKK
jgi:hypothetical protein